MENQTEQALTQEAQRPQPIETVEDMGNLVLRWFQNRHQQVSQLRNVPDHDTQEITDQDTGEVFTLEGETLKAFKMGLAVAQTIFIDPPFQVLDSEEEPTA